MENDNEREYGTVEFFQDPETGQIVNIIIRDQKGNILKRYEDQ